MKYLFVLVLFAALILTSCTYSSMQQEIVIIQTSQGDIELELYSQEAPTTVDNFRSYVESGFYDETVFHRVIEGFMIQGGGFSVQGVQKPTNDPIALEASLPNTRGSVAMARTNDPDSATAQFFINVADNTALNPGVQGPGYAVFAHVVEGMEVVDAIVQSATTTRYGMADWPQEDVVIERVYLKG